MTISKPQVLDELRRVKGPDLAGNIVDRSGRDASSGSGTSRPALSGRTDGPACARRLAVPTNEARSQRCPGGPISAAARVTSHASRPTNARICYVPWSPGSCSA